VSDGLRWESLAADIRRAATPRGRERLGSFVVEGTRLHERALRAGRAFHGVLVGQGLAGDTSERVVRLLAELRGTGCPLAVAPAAVLEELMDGRGGGALVGLVRNVEPPGLSEVVASARGPVLALAACEVEDPGNVGALSRTALAAGATFFAATGISDPFHPKAVRTSMGAVFRLAVLRYPSPALLLRELRSASIMTLAAVSRGGESPSELDPGSGAVAVLVGSEARGLPTAVTEASDRRVTIPMVEDVDSFSVNAAAAIVLYEIGRGRREGRK